MSDQTLNPEELLAEPNAGAAEDIEAEIDVDTPQGRFALSQKDLSRMKRIGRWHGAAVLAGLGLYGAANAWAVSSGLMLAHAVAIGNAVVVASALSGIFHEWGHFTGAKLTGSIAPVSKKPVRFYFMFNFDMEQNSVSQFIALSLGGILANWLLVLLIVALIPITSVAAAALVAVAIARAVNVSLFEVPVVQRVRESQDPGKELNHQLETFGLKQTPGVIAGALAFLAFT